MPVSDQLISEYRTIHATRRYGATGHKALPYILPHVLALRPDTVLDYGCGQSNLVDLVATRSNASRALRYDPAVADYAERPQDVSDLAINVDVLEHIPENELDATLADIAALARNAIFVIDTWPARLHLSDGRNAHVSLFSADTWKGILERTFPFVVPIHIRRHGRVGFKTFAQSLPPLEARIVTSREIAARHLARIGALLHIGA